MGSSGNEAVAWDLDFYTNFAARYHEHFCHDEVLGKVIRTFVSTLPANAQVIECGPGTGIAAATIVDSGCHLHGIDQSEGMLAICRQRVPRGTFEVADMLKYDPLDVRYDGVVASLSLFELNKEETAAMMGKWHRWLKPEGLLLIGTWDPEKQGVAPDKFDMDGCATKLPFEFMDHTVYNTLFTQTGWKKMLGNAGFELVRTETDSFQPAGDCIVEERYYITAKRTNGTQIE